MINLTGLNRINVVGTSGSGKSAFSQKLADAIGAPHIEIDQLHWRSNWTFASDEELTKSLARALRGYKWVLDGNYTRTIPVKWKQVQTVIWLDYPFRVVLARALKRALYRLITRAEIWEGTGNRETLKMLFSKDSIVWWTVTTYRKNREKYVELMNDSNYRHIRFIRLKSPREAVAFLELLKMAN